MITGSVLEEYKTRMEVLSSSGNAWFISSGNFRPHYDPGVVSTSNRNDYQEYFMGGKGSWCVVLTTLSSSCADRLEIWDPQLPETLRACSVLYSHCFTFLLIANVNIQNDVCCVMKMPTQLATFPLYNSQVWPVRTKSKGLHKSPPVDHTVSLLNPVQNLTSGILILSFRWQLRTGLWYLLFRFPD